VSQRISEGEVPEEIRLVNEFLNTLDLEKFGEHAEKPEEERDELRSVEGLRAWLVERGLLAEREPVTEDDRELSVTVRDALREAAWANVRKEDGCPPEAATRALGELPLLVRLGEDMRPQLVPRLGGVKGALARILADAAVAASRGTWARLKICAAEDCRWAYYDHSKSHTGRWCSMQVCGNRHKTRRYRRKKREIAQEGG
jgi:predicted RNA-binding Zn ribbon-like protein